ncbi:hypothetical protein PL78_03860 [Yersinia entomophaga]|uniref:DUF2628 domain-containing protein n=1 Tax=Yersinia entomophaga TaxID=935293 RepID=A0ABM6BHM9_YERET|nr:MULTISPECIES: DUF2628 domain-containing protein [Yersinia]ANI28974.1 hypothetical protein PL78_03860 [Yersinia entomophaga]OWF88800.1 hypothetical protein B4914_06215 [Yersinia entomophaga]
MSNVDIGSNEKPDHSIKNNRFRGYNKSWERKFLLMDKLGFRDDKYSGDQTLAKQLAFGDRFTINFNAWALLFGSVYYFIKGMWQKGLIIMAAGILFSAFAIFLGYERQAYLIPSVVTALMANVDFYRLSRFNEKIWPKFPAIFGKIKFCLLVLVFSLVIGVMTVVASERAELETSACSVLTEILQWQLDSNATCKKVTIDEEVTEGFYRAHAVLDNGNEMLITLEQRNNQIYVVVPEQ